MATADERVTGTGDGPGPAEASGDLLEEALRLMPDAAIAVDDGGRIVAANAAAERLFRYPAGGLSGVSVDSLVPARLRTRHVEHRHTYADHPMRRPMGAGLQLWAERRDATEFPVDISLVPLDSDGQLLTLAAVRDITTQRADWETEARLAAIVASSDDAMFALDLAGAIGGWNPAAEQLFGYRAADVIGRSFWRLVPPSLQAQVEERMGRLRAGMRVPTHDTRRVRADGTEVDVAESMSLVTDAARQPTGYSVVLRDITDRKRQESELRQLLAESQRRERWLAAISEVRLALFGGPEQPQWLELITRRVAELLDADGVMVALPVADDPDDLRLVAARGRSILGPGDLVPMELSLAGRAFRSGQLVVTEDLRTDSPAPEGLVGDVDIGPMVLAPLVSASGPTGVLLVTRSAGRAGFDAEDVRLVESFAQQAGLGIELARAQAERAQFVLVADRERIARDLHDHVIQRLFAVGMGLQAAAHTIADPRALERIEESVEELDATIRDVRSTIFSLEVQATEHVEKSTRSRILDVASLAAPALGFQPRLQFEGPIDTRVPEEFVPDVLAVVREALSNTARHAAAHSVEVRVKADRDHLAIAVVDDGRGAADRTRSSGLANLAARAEGRGGTMSVGDGRNGRGTRVEWTVPLPG
ncbi:MAG: PAS domain S-box protein [Acidobacteriota bacterium]|nr:PAS domain S-box protein [Acidobacteriota bacterium]